MGKTAAGTWVQCGREFSTQEIEEIRETVAWLPGLARGELAATVCEHLDWHTAAGTPKIQACQKLLERLEAAGLVELPSIKRQKAPTGKRAGDQQQPISDLSLGPIKKSGIYAIGKSGPGAPRTLARDLWVSPCLAGDLCRETTLPGYLLQGRQLGPSGPNQRPRQTRSRWKTERSNQGLMGLSLGSTLQGCANPLIFLGMG
jgi:hypothetical protein